MSTAYDAWLTSVDTDVEEYERYWNAYFEKADEMFQDGEYNDEFIDFLESGDWNKRYEDLRGDFIKKKAMRLEKADSLIAADILTEKGDSDYD